MNRRELVLSLVQDLLAAPGSEKGWQAFLSKLCEALDGSGANFISLDFTAPASQVFVTARTPVEALALYHQHWAGEDVWARRGAKLRAGAVVAGDQLIERAEFERTAFFNDFGRHFEVGQCLTGIVESTPPRAMAVLSINRAAGASRFGPEDSRLISALMPSMERALQLHRRLSGAELLAANARDVLDRLPHGVILLSSRGLMRAANGAAERLLHAADGLSVDRGELRAETVALTQKLRRAIAEAVSTHRELTIEGRRAVLALPRGSGRRSLSVVIAPLPRRRPALGESVAAVMFITDPESSALPDVETIRLILGLTASEAELVRCLVSGLSLQAAASRLSVRVETVRKRLKQIFQKTDTHRQADLVRLVLASAGPNHSR